MRTLRLTLIWFFGAFSLCGLSIKAQEKADPIQEEWRIKREDVFEFAVKPTITSATNKVTINFETKGYCDVTVAIETHEGKIIRHLACGVLGANAPEPFAKNSKSQTIVWDCKDELGKYIDNKENYRVRVSLGLKPQFERTLLWSPHRRANGVVIKGTVMKATPEGVYVCDGGQAPDHIRLMSHKGDYIKTVYPFSSQNIKNIKGLMTTPFPQDGKVLPVKPSYQMCTLLTSGDNALNINFKDGAYFQAAMDPCHKGENGRGIYEIAINGNKIAVLANRLNRVTTEGTSGGLDFYGPWVCLRSEKGFYKATDSAFSIKMTGGYEAVTHLKPSRSAFSPDGKTLYMTRFTENFALDMFIHNYWQHGVYKMNYEENKEPELFLGNPEHGNDNTRFFMPADVTCDSKGRVYVADCGNHRIQIFSPDGKFLKTIPVEAPTQIIISPKDEIYVSTWEYVPNKNVVGIKVEKPNILRKFKSFEDPALLATYDLPIAPVKEKYGQLFEIDFWSQPPTVWVNPSLIPITEWGQKKTRPSNIALYAMNEKSLDFIRDFESEARASVIEPMAPEANRQRMFWNPKSEKLYVGDGPYHFQDVICIDPKTGKNQKIPLPFDAEDMAFDYNGLAYLRTPNFLTRYDPDNWKEVPFDYGEEREGITYNTSSSRREGKAVSGIPLPSNSNWHHGGMHISPNGSIAIGVLFELAPSEKGPKNQPSLNMKKLYQPLLFPGRIVHAAYGCEYVHIWDKHGKLLFDDAVKGLGTLNGVGVDQQNNVYVMASSPRANKDLKPFNYLAGTLIKFKPGTSKIISDAPGVPAVLPANEIPKRQPDLLNHPGKAWVEGAEWFYGGIGWHGKNNGVGCGCRNTRFALDYFGRSFAPEIDRYSVAALDTNGNLILRIGTYGNIEDGKPLIAEGGPANTRSIGGDEVSLVHGAYVATQSDQRIFIADISNYRIVSVAIKYHANETVPLTADSSGTPQPK